MKQLQWYGCYRESWGNDLVADAFSHPAKVQPALSRRIIEHMIEQGYIQPGSIIVDPFSGVAGFALACMMNGLHYRGCELEADFVKLGQANIELWNNRYAAHFPNWGTAEITRGDSRFLSAVLSLAGGAVSSPPFSDSLSGKGRSPELRPDGTPFGQGRSIDLAKYGRSPNQLGNMKEGDIAAVIDGAISSPPFSPSGNQPTGRGQGVRQDYKNGKLKESSPESDYGGSPGNLGNLPPGDIAAVTSPPYAETVQGVGEGPGARFDHVTHRGDNATKKSSANGYGQTEGNLGNLAAGAVISPPWEDANSVDIYGSTNGNLGNLAAGAVTSPPFEKQQSGGGLALPDARHNDGHLFGDNHGYQNQGDTNGQLGNATGPTFWAAARDILTELYAVLTPGGYAAFVCGDYVRDKKRVNFGRQWLQLCTAAGFEPVEWITAWKTEPGPVQAGLFDNGSHTTIERSSFFRKLANNRARAAEHWKAVGEDGRAAYLEMAASELWAAYDLGQTPPDEIEEPVMPEVKTVDTLRQYRDDLREYKRLVKAIGQSSKPPTDGRILEYARLLAWKAAGAEPLAVDEAILNEDVLIVRKPLEEE